MSLRFVALHFPVSVMAKCIARDYLLFYNNYYCFPNCLHVYMIRVRGAITSPSFVALILLVSEIANYIV